MSENVPIFFKYRFHETGHWHFAKARSRQMKGVSDELECAVIQLAHQVLSVNHYEIVSIYSVLEPTWRRLPYRGEFINAYFAFVAVPPSTCSLYHVQTLYIDRIIQKLTWIHCDQIRRWIFFVPPVCSNLWAVRAASSEQDELWRK